MWLYTNPKTDRWFNPLYSYQYCYVLGFTQHLINNTYTGIILSMTSHSKVSLVVKIKLRKKKLRKLFMNLLFQLFNIMSMFLIYYFQYKATSNP